MAVVAQVVYPRPARHWTQRRGRGAQMVSLSNGEDVHCFREALSRATIVMGHSLGGIVATVYAAGYPGHPSKRISQQ
jgi:pimeloyl-ACP methyl ester carboxylesterase